MYINRHNFTIGKLARFLYHNFMNPETVIPTDSLQFSSFYKNPQVLLPLLALIILNLGVFYLSFNNSKLNLVGWKALTDNQSFPAEPAAVVYEMEGKITMLDRNRLSIENNGQTETFITPLTRYSIVAPFNSTEEWPTRVISVNQRSEFNLGDQVTLLISGDRFAPANKNSFLLQRVIKVQQ